MFLSNFYLDWKKADKKISLIFGCEYKGLFFYALLRAFKNEMRIGINEMRIIPITIAEKCCLTIGKFPKK